MSQTTPRGRAARAITKPLARGAAVAVAVSCAVPALTAAAATAAGGHRPAPVVYVADVNARPGTLTPISTASNKPGPPIRVGTLPDAGAPIRVAQPPGYIEITPNGRTAYVEGTSTVTPVDTATNTAGKPIRAGDGPRNLVIVPAG